MPAPSTRWRSTKSTRDHVRLTARVAGGSPTSCRRCGSGCSRLTGSRRRPRRLRQGSIRAGGARAETSGRRPQDRSEAMRPAPHPPPETHVTTLPAVSPTATGRSPPRHSGHLHRAQAQSQGRRRRRAHCACPGPGRGRGSAPTRMSGEPYKVEQNSEPRRASQITLAVSR